MPRPAPRRAVDGTLITKSHLVTAQMIWMREHGASKIGYEKKYKFDGGDFWQNDLAKLKTMLIELNEMVQEILP